MASTEDFLGNDNDEAIFYAPDRTKAEIIWFTSGFLEYRIKLPPLTKPIKEIEVTFESCSEAPLYNNNYKSDISLLLNNKSIGTWCCPGDFGGLNGQLNPPFWPSKMTQYGILTHWKINESGTSMNNSFISYTRISEIDFTKQPYLSIKIGVHKNAKHCGGINLFGKNFGNSPTDILVKITM
jgi:predicted transcriptional regulator